MSDNQQQTVAGMALEGMGLLHRLDSLSSVPAQAELRDMPLDLLLDLRRAVAMMHPAGWQVLCAIDARLVEHAGRKRGRAGRDGTRLYARYHRLRDYATRLNLPGPRILLRNEAIHQLLIQAEIINVKVGGARPTFVTIASVLTKREDYEEALIYAAPIVALRQSAARRLLGERLEPPPLTRHDSSPTSEVCATTKASNAPSPAPQLACETCRVIEHVRRTTALFQEKILPDCPNQRWRDRLYLDWVDDLNDTLNDLGKHEHEEGHACL